MTAGQWPTVRKGQPPPAVVPQALFDLPVGSAVGVVGRGLRAVIHRTSTGRWTAETPNPAHESANTLDPRQLAEHLAKVDGVVYLLRVGNGSRLDKRGWNSANAVGALLPAAASKGP